MRPYSAIFVLTGAGISAESGIQTFRSSDGLWENHRLEDVATPEGFDRDPGLVQQFYNDRRRQLLSVGVAPNAAHVALARLAQAYPGKVTLVTQNVDDLHERGGSPAVLHMHGELRKARCMRTGAVEPRDQDITAESRCACCGQTGTLRPHIVWFGEMPLYMDEILKLLRACKLFVAIGTSGQVFPAAQFAVQARKAHRIEINPERTPISEHFDRLIDAPATVGVIQLVGELLAAVRS